MAAGNNENNIPRTCAAAQISLPYWPASGVRTLPAVMAQVWRGVPAVALFDKIPHTRVEGRARYSGGTQSFSISVVDVIIKSLLMVAEGM